MHALCSDNEVRRHQSPLCCCEECLSFDHGITLPMQRVAEPTTTTVIPVIDTETSKRFIYSYQQGTYSSSLTRKPVTVFSSPAHLTPQSGKQSRLGTLLRTLVLEKIERSIQAHPFLWLCLSMLLRS